MVDSKVDGVFRYGQSGDTLGDFDLESHHDSRGATTTATGDPLWVVDKTGQVDIYDTLAEESIGSWEARDVKNPQGIATDGQHVWIVDAKRDRVYFYQDAASRRSGRIDATSTFHLKSQNKNPTGITTDGDTIWVVDSKDRIYVYDTDGTSLGNWRLDSRNKNASGVTINPSGGNGLWVVGRSDDAIYYYAAGADRLSGRQSASSVMQLARQNKKPEGIADPAVPIALGQVINADISVAGEIDDYTFNPNAGQTLFFDRQAGSVAGFTWRLVDPNGSEVFMYHLRPLFRGPDEFWVSR